MVIKSILRGCQAALAVVLILIAAPGWTLTATQVAKLSEVPDLELNAYDYFGYHQGVAVSGDTAVVGAFWDDERGLNAGAAYVFVREGTTWALEAKLMAPEEDGKPNDWFGISVAISGDTVVIGAYRHDHGGQYDSGAAYVFVRSGTTWTQQAKLTAEFPEYIENFGASVALAGETAVVGANYSDRYDSETDEVEEYDTGAAYVFVRSGTMWTQQARLTASDGDPGERFGYSADITGNTAVIGAVWGNDRGSRSGKAYVFVRSSTGWSQEGVLIPDPDDRATNDHFGQSVSVAGSTALVGAYAHDQNGENSSGAAYVFVRSGSTWIQQAKLSADEPSALDGFGVSVALAGDTAVVGAFRDEQGVDDSGTADVFVREGTIWKRQDTLTAGDAAALDYFGNSVALSAETVVVGANGDDDHGTFSGSAYVFSLDDQGPVVSAVVADPAPAPINSPISLTAKADDSLKGNSDIESASYSIDGNAWETMNALYPPFDSATEEVVAEIPAIVNTGVYEICVQATDVIGNTGADECILLAVYDPEGGFVTGGGWIDSPVGAYAPDPSLTGKANFGFVSKYKKGAHTPTGTTEFHFKAGDLNFHANSYEWLVVAGKKAMYKGVGTINGTGNYGFMLMAIDEKLSPSTDVDLFRIKIWDKDDGDEVVYDNQMGEDETADPTTEIGGGSIIIHKN